MKESKECINLIMQYDMNW